MKNVSVFLDTVDSLENLSVMEFNDCFALVPNEERTNMEKEGWQDYEISRGAPGCFDLIDIKQEEMMVGQAVQINSSYEYDLPENHENPDEPTTKVRSARKSFPAWFRKKIQESRLLKKTENGMVNIWTCCVCNEKSFTTETGVRFHLINSHYQSLKTSNPEDIEQNVSDQNTIKYSRDPEWIKKMVDQSKDATLNNNWICCLCQSVNSAAPFGIQQHILRMHCESSKKPEMKKIDKYERDPVWIKEMVEKSCISDGDDKRWICCICGQLESLSSFGITLHISRVHCHKPLFNNAQNTIEENSDMTTKMDAVESEKHDRNLDWIKEMVNKSKDDISPNSWSCCICNNITLKTELGIRFHIMRMHCKKQHQPVEAVDANPRHEYDVLWINEMIEKSFTSDGSWTCCVCGDHTTVSRHGIHIHISRLHCESRKKLQFPTDIPETDGRNDSGSDSTAETTNEADDDYVDKKSPKAKVRMGKKWLRKMVVKSEKTVMTAEGAKKMWICIICKDLTRPTSKGMLLHIARMHRKNNRSFAVKDRLSNVVQQDEDELSFTAAGSSRAKTKLEDSDQKLLKHLIKNSQKGTKYTCAVCSSDKKTYQSIRYHILASHMKHINVNVYQKKGDMGKEELEWLYLNMKISKDEKHSQWKCNFCHKVYLSYQSIRHHLAMKHMPSTLKQSATASRYQEDDDESALPEVEEQFTRI